jgi:hypothetical protein
MAAFVPSSGVAGDGSSVAGARSSVAGAGFGATVEIFLLP